jgi:opacity protein-like surface antigen
MKGASLYKAICLLVVGLVCATTAVAQDTQRFEAFGGYSLLHDSHSLPEKISNFSGWDSSLTVYLNRWFGVTSDFSGHYGSAIYVIPTLPGGTAGKKEYTNNSYTFLFGPHFVYHRSRYAPFGQALFGVIHELTPSRLLVDITCPPPNQMCTAQVTGARTSDTNFAMALGGGLDIDIGHGISIRPVQAEYLLRRYSEVQNNRGTLVTIVNYRNDFRYSTGVVFNFGPHR